MHCHLGRGDFSPGDYPTRWLLFLINFTPAMRSLFSYTSPSIAACHSKTEVSNGTGRGKADCIELMVAYTCIWYGQSSLKALNWSQMLCGPTQMLPTRREGQWNLKQYLLLDKPNSNHRKTCVLNYPSPTHGASARSIAGGKPGLAQAPKLPLITHTATA